MGRLIPGETLRELISYVEQENLHLVSDEIYAGSVFDERRVEFQSALSAVEGHRDALTLTLTLSLTLIQMTGPKS